MQSTSPVIYTLNLENAHTKQTTSFKVHRQATVRDVMDCLVREKLYPPDSNLHLLNHGIKVNTRANSYTPLCSIASVSETNTINLKLFHNTTKVVKLTLSIFKSTKTIVLQISRSETVSQIMQRLIDEKHFTCDDQLTLLNGSQLVDTRANLDKALCSIATVSRDGEVKLNIFNNKVKK